MKLKNNLSKFLDAWGAGFIVGVIMGLPVGIILLMWAMKDPL